MSGDKEVSCFESPPTCATLQEAEACSVIAFKYLTLCEDLQIEQEIPTRVLAALILSYHKKREALRLDLLATYGQPGSVVRMNDFAHDIAGILRHDVHQSARFALSYHPLSVLPLGYLEPVTTCDGDNGPSLHQTPDPEAASDDVREHESHDENGPVAP